VTATTMPEKSAFISRSRLLVKHRHPQYFVTGIPD
jgi:hypothetical protein